MCKNEIGRIAGDVHRRIIHTDFDARTLGHRGRRMEIEQRRAVVHAEEREAGWGRCRIGAWVDYGDSGFARGIDGLEGKIEFGGV